MMICLRAVWRMSLQEKDTDWTMLKAAVAYRILELCVAEDFWVLGKKILQLQISIFYLMLSI